MKGWGMGGGIEMMPMCNIYPFHTKQLWFTNWLNLVPPDLCRALGPAPAQALPPQAQHRVQKPVSLSRQGRGSIP